MRRSSAVPYFALGSTARGIISTKASWRDEQVSNARPPREAGSIWVTAPVV
ncbi:hypothetical protein N9L68_02515 [bacterium]|nr:hypothetical protein [bacterium]